MGYAPLLCRFERRKSQGLQIHLPYFVFVRFNRLHGHVDLPHAVNGLELDGDHDAFDCVPGL